MIFSSLKISSRRHTTSERSGAEKCRHIGHSGRSRPRKLIMTTKQAYRGVLKIVKI
jgi:hypothetical protein